MRFAGVMWRSWGDHAWEPNAITITRDPARLTAIDHDCNDIPDCGAAAAVAALFC
jgi:3-phosphoshikimate 1-carboxyvinyltransferase